MPHPRAFEIISAARACVGTRFRPQGRLPGTGLDCAGLILAAAHAINFPIDAPRDYSLRCDGLTRMAEAALARCLTLQPGEHRPGDLLLLETAPGLPHLAIASEAGIIHAHAGLGRVVEAPLPAEWPITRVYRFEAAE